MPCYSPLTGYKSRFLTEKGKRKIVFNRSHGFSDQTMQVPCGQCIGCRIEKSRMWAIRCTHESRMHTANCFVTLTYAPENLPPGETLVIRDLQLFNKRLRKTLGPFRFYACGEYGEKGNRPHYHLVIFGLNFAADRKLYSLSAKGNPNYTSQTLTEIWGKGRAELSDFNYSTAAYTARYVMKKQNGKNAMQHENYSRLNTSSGEIYQVQPEFALMSRRPGIGAGWYEQYKTDAFPSDFLIHQGRKHTVPRYYLDKLTKENPTEAETIKQKRKQARITTAANNTSDRLAVREECKTAQLSQLTRSL
ncbi:MAG: replication initiator protein [Microvirus sp.]|nr:MAG: replication initiator protein [Microvirus sp.]